MAYRYYSTLRPLMVGGIPFPKQPGESITTIVNFEEGRTYCKDIDRPAWGYIEYTAPLDPQQVSDYELVLAPQQAAPVVSSADKKAPPPEKPVSWLPPVGAKGLMFLRCPKCKDEFVQFLREPQTAHECRKCGAKIPLDALARFEYTCPDCKKVSYGRTNIEDAEITNQKFSCVCGRSIPKLTWDPVKHCYTM